MAATALIMEVSDDRETHIPLCQHFPAFLCATSSRPIISPLQFWTQDRVNPAVWISIVLVLIIIVNFCGVKVFGEMEVLGVFVEGQHPYRRNTHDAYSSLWSWSYVSTSIDSSCIPRGTSLTLYSIGTM